MSLKSEAKVDAHNKFSDVIGMLDFSMLTYGVFMRAIGVELAIAHEDRDSDEYDQKYFRVLEGLVEEFCQDHGWPTPAELLGEYTRRDLGLDDSFVTDEIAKITDLPAPYGSAAKKIVDEHREERKRTKAFRKILEAAGEDPSYEKVAHKFYKAIDSGSYGGIELGPDFEAQVNRYFYEMSWPTREEHQKMSSERKQESGLYDDFWFHPLHPAGAFLIDGVWIEPEDAFKQGLRESIDLGYEDGEDIFKTAEELGLDLGYLIPEDSSPKRVEAVANLVYGPTEWITPGR